MKPANMLERVNLKSLDLTCQTSPGEIEIRHSSLGGAPGLARGGEGPLLSMIAAGVRKNAHRKQRPQAAASGGGPIARRLRRASQGKPCGAVHI